MEETKNNATEKVENITRLNQQADAAGVTLEAPESVAEREAQAKLRMEERERRVKFRERKTFGDGNDGNDGNDDAPRKKKTPGNAGWIFAVTTLSFLTLVFATMYAFSLGEQNGTYDGVYQTVDQAYYDLVNYVQAMDVDMSKLIVSNDQKKQQKLLGELNVKSELATLAVTRLPLQDESRFYTTKIINQIGDYSKYLNNKLIDGLSITATDKDNLLNLYETNKVLKRELSDLTADMGAEYDMKLLIDGSENLVFATFDKMEENAVDYPKLIYDGPFSDALDGNQVLGLTGEVISAMQAQEIVIKKFADYKITDATVIGESKERMDLYNLDCKLEDGQPLFVQVSKKGGKIVAFECYKDCKQNDYDLETCRQIAEKAMKTFDLNDMQAVWGVESGAVAYFNLTFTLDDVIFYPDMVKVTVCKERGLVSSMDAREYYFNHASRSVEQPTIDQNAARERISENLTVNNVRLCVVPYGENKEALAYEVAGERDEQTFYIYVDAKTGNEIEIFAVVQTTEGQLLV